MSFYERNIQEIVWLFDFRPYLHWTKWAILPCVGSWCEMPCQAVNRGLVVTRKLVFLIKIWIHTKWLRSRSPTDLFRFQFWLGSKGPTSTADSKLGPPINYSESIESLLGNSFLPALSKDRRRPLKIRQLYTMNKALCEFNENLVDKTTGDLNTENVATYLNQLGSGRRIKSQNERDIHFRSIR